MNIIILFTEYNTHRSYFGFHLHHKVENHAQFGEGFHGESVLEENKGICSLILRDTRPSQVGIPNQFTVLLLKSEVWITDSEMTRSSKKVTSYSRCSKGTKIKQNPHTPMHRNERYEP